MADDGSALGGITLGKKAAEGDERKKGLARVPTPKVSLRTESEVVKGEDFHMNMPPQYKFRRYYLPSEVAVHNTPDNCWISMFN